MRTTLLAALAASIITACVDDVPPTGGESTSDVTGTTTTTSTTTEASTTTTTAVDTTEGVSTDTGADSSSSSVDTSSGPDSTGADPTGDPPPTGGYGDCANPPQLCDFPEEACLFSGNQGVCAWQGCETVADCPISDLPGPMPDHPTPAQVACVDVSGRGVAECVLDCSVGLTAGCPEGMTCLGLGDTAVCLWPVAPEGGGVCPDQDIGSRIGQTVMGDNTGLVDDHYPLCSFGGGEDALLQWGPAPADGTYTFDTIGSGFDTVLAVLDGCGGTEIACGDDQVGMFSQVSVDLVAGQSIILVVDSYDGATGPFVLNVQ